MSRLRRAVVLAALVGMTSWGTPAEADLKEIEKRGTLRVIVSADELPHMFSFEEGGPPGLEREMLEGFARMHGLEIEVVKMERFEDVIPALLQGRGDLITGIIDTPVRRERIAFTVETLPARHVAVNRRPAAPVTRGRSISSLSRPRELG